MTSFVLLIALLTGQTARTTTDTTVRLTKRTSAKTLVARPGLLIIAHRGNSSVAPENTIPAFRSAIKAEADLIELDYYHAADGVPIVFHDKTLDRTTDAVSRWGKKEAAVTAFASQDLFRLDAGAWFDPRFAGTRVPTLQQSLRVIQTGSTTLIERKGGDAKTVVDLLKRMKLTDQVVLQAFDWDFLADAHRLNPGLVLAALGSKELDQKQIMRIGKTGARIVAWNHKDLDARAVELVHRAGWKSWCYTVNSAAEADRVVEFGIDGIITDRPSELKSMRLRRR